MADQRHEPDLVERFAVAIVGAGVAGAASAIALAQAGIGPVCLLGARQGGRAVGECLPPDASDALTRLGLWKEFLGQGHLACPGSRSIWGGPNEGFNDFIFSPRGSGWHLDRAGFEDWLVAEAQAAGAVLWPKARATAVTRQDNGCFTLDLCDAADPAMSADVVIDATGAAAWIARQMGARRRVLDSFTNLSVWFERVDPDTFGASTRLEAVQGGWWYGALLPGRQAVLSFSTDAGTARQILARGFPAWARALGETRLASRGLNGSLCLADSLTAVAALSSRLDRSAGLGWAAVGDAAAAFDPISSAGITKALQGALRLAPLVRRYLDGCDDALAGMDAPARSEFTAYAAARSYFYAQETRWSKAPFWQARQRANAAHAPPGQDARGPAFV
ncbi:NAD(P)/FAD-dependent oxidoreductase [Thetidibacter halocola]|uniref:Tryptophan 7-halogenase n=1 Tax=Thetidibacter halocola TaxID=2827239 RepID=A0A8J7WFS5_9RHOB|nr:tryptophan 7-halogenase [Thetidibacter halocola]MBS0126877.1 tryptophan 7-halogenase [Thetidibacter halocola]